jgi:hypothetical protein
MNLGLFDAVVLSPCGFHLDPRHEYWAKSLEDAGYQTLRFEVLEDADDGSLSRFLRLQNGLLTVGSNRKISNQEFRLKVGADEFPAKSPLGRYIKARLARMLYAISHDSLCNLRPSVVVANDLLGAVLAVAMWGDTTCRIIYDAQEVFTDSYDLLGGPVFSESERIAWIELESNVCKRADLTVTISPGIAQLYKTRHDTVCEILPNYIPKARSEIRQSDSSSRPKRFVLIGRADPHRGLEELVESWDIPEDIATLDLIMPETPQRGRLEAHCSQVKRLHAGPRFVAAVPPDQMIKTLSFYDVGILPYKYPYPYSHASPNKFGEYVGAGLAVLANDQPFVTEQVSKHSLGQIFSWGASNEFLASVFNLSDSDNLGEITENVKTAFETSLNWESAGTQVWRFIGETRSTRSRPDVSELSKPDEVTQFCEVASKFEELVWRCRRQIIKFAQIAWTRFR